MRGTRQRISRWSILPVLLLTLSLLPVAAAPASAAEQGTTGTLTIDAPTRGAALVNGRAATIGGWAVEPSARGTGVERVSVYLDGQPGSGVHIGEARYGIPRPDVAAALRQSEWANSGFTLDWTPRGISQGDHTLYVVAQSASGERMVQTVPVVVEQARASDAYNASGLLGAYGTGYGGYGGYGYGGYGGYGYGGYYPGYSYGHGYYPYSSYGYGGYGYGRGYGYRGYGGYGYGGGYGYRGGYGGFSGGLRAASDGGFGGRGGFGGHGGFGGRGGFHSGHR